MIWLLKILSFIFIISLGACLKKPHDSICKTDDDCKINAHQGVCHMGKCQECLLDSDCFDLKQCIDHRCLSSCQADNDCSVNEHCQNNLCILSPKRDLEQEVLLIKDECGSYENIHFDFDKANIKEDDRKLLNKLTDCLNKHPSWSVTIAGHTDFRGTPSYNEALGQRRADEVRKYLLTLGIEIERIKTISYGDQRPVIDERNEYAYAQNRRAEFLLDINE